MVKKINTWPFLLGVFCFPVLSIDDIDYHFCFGGSDPNVDIQIPDLPKGYNLTSVQVIVRHGARTPLWYDTQWKCKESEIIDYSLDHQQEERRKKRIFRIEKVDKMGQATARCTPGQLTSLGVSQSTNVGKALRRAYIEKIPLLSKDLKPSEFMIRATSAIRAQQAAEGVLRGLYPHQPKRADVVLIGVRPADKEDLIPNVHICPALKGVVNAQFRTDDGEYQIRKAQTALAITEDSMNASSIFNKPKYGLQEGSVLPWMSELDAVRSAMCHKKPIPEKINESVRKVLYRLDDWSWGRTYYSNYSVKALGPFLSSTFAENFVRQVKKSDDVKFRLFAAHDVTLAGVLGALEIFDGRSPPLASQLIFELLSKEDENFVRILYNGKQLVPPACKSNNDICSWKEWTSLIELLHAKVMTLNCKVPMELSDSAIILHLNRKIVDWAGAVIGIILCLALAAVLCCLYKRLKGVQTTEEKHVSEAEAGKTTI